MRYLVTGEQMKEIDRYTIETIGIPSMVLMERAAMAVAREAEALVKKTDGIWAVCGTGNNGADGIAAARMLALKGYCVTIIVVGNLDRGTREFHIQKTIAGNLNLPVVEWQSFILEKPEGLGQAGADLAAFGPCDLIIDGVFGVGLTRNVEGEYREVLEAMKSMSGARVVAVDMPSGIHSATGQIMGTALKADVTVTFGWEKLGSVLYPGREYCGRVVTEDIGFPSVSLKKAHPCAWTYGKEDLAGIPPRPPYSNKGTFGKVLLAAGCRGMSGAAYLAALGAYRAGAGLVKILTAEENRTILQQLLPEAILTTYNQEELAGAGEEECSRLWERRMEKECGWADVIVLGPGLGQEPYVKNLVKGVLTSAYVPIVVDADGLNTIAANPGLRQYYTENIVITPHLGEMARLTGKTVAEIQRDVAGTAADYSRRHGIVCVLKDAATVTADRDGQCYVNTSGNSCMAKAGSGDVLAGIVAGLLAQGMEPFQGASMGVFLHGLAGDQYRESHGSGGMLARELAEEVGRLIP